MPSGSHFGKPHWKLYRAYQITGNLRFQCSIPKLTHGEGEGEGEAETFYGTAFHRSSHVKSTGPVSVRIEVLGGIGGRSNQKQRDKS